MKKQVDLFGRSILVGDFISYAVSHRSAVVMRVAVVDEIRMVPRPWRPEELQPKLFVRAAAPRNGGQFWEKLNGGSRLFLTNITNVVRLDADTVPSEVKQLLEYA